MKPDKQKSSSQNQTSANPINSLGKTDRHMDKHLDGSVATASTDTTIISQTQMHTLAPYVNYVKTRGKKPIISTHIAVD
jgi:hypothetical protein